MSTLDVIRHGHLNHFTGDHADTVAFLRDGVGASVWHEWETPPAGSTNALIALGPACIELFAPKDPAGAIGSYLERRPEGWHSLEWTVPDLSRAIEVFAEHGIRVTEADDDYLFTHPKDLAGLSLEITHHRFADLGEGDPRERPGWDTSRGTGDVFTFAGVPEVLLVSADPAASAALVATLTGLDVMTWAYPELGVDAHGIDLGDHVVAFVDPGAVAAELTLPTVGVWALVLPVDDVATAEETLRGRGVGDIELVSASSVWISPAANRGATVAFRQPR